MSFKNAGTKLNKFSPSQNRSNFLAWLLFLLVQFVGYFFGGLLNSHLCDLRMGSEEPVVAGELCSKVLPQVWWWSQPIGLGVKVMDEDMAR